MKKKAVTVEWQFVAFDETHYDKRFFEKTQLYCPSCGKQEVWKEEGAGDFYEGVDYNCTGCMAYFTLPSLGSNADSDEGKQIIKQLRGN